MTTAGKGRDIAPAGGKLGVLLPGMGAVATTFIAGVEAARRGLAKPIGSLTQMVTVRLGKRTEGRSPMVKDFVPLADLDQIHFGGWDVYPDSAYEAARKAGVLEARHLAEALAGVKVKDHAVIRPVEDPYQKTGGLAILFDQHTTIFDAVDADLTLDGLAILAARAGAA